VWKSAHRQTREEYGAAMARGGLEGARSKEGIEGEEDVHVADEICVEKTQRVLCTNNARRNGADRGRGTVGKDRECDNAFLHFNRPSLYPNQIHSLPVATLVS